MKTDISPARNSAYKVLFDVIENKAFSNISLNINLNMRNANDRALATNIVYGTLKKYNRLYKIFCELSATPAAKVDRRVRIIILMSLYQMLYLKKVPEYAIVNDAVNMTKFYAYASASGYVNGVLRSALRTKNELIRPEEDFNEFMHTEYGFEPWLIDLLRKSFSEEELLDLAEAFEEPPELTLRVNTLKVSTDTLIKNLSLEGIEAQKCYVPGALSAKGGNIFKTASFKRGEFFAQDLSGIIAGYAAGFEKDDKILDICAAPGAKSFGAAILSRGAQITSCDNNSNKLDLLRMSAMQLGISGISTSRRDSAKSYASELSRYDKIIADVPCSGLGVIGRKPEILMNLTPEHLEKLYELQHSLLTTALSYLKSGGTLIYSTCTINPEENEKLVERVLAENKNVHLTPIALPFELICTHKEMNSGFLKLSPVNDYCDGFFIAKIQAE